MSKIVTVAAYKGGVGKTTLALELAYFLAAPLVDLDWDGGGVTRTWGYRPTERSPLLDALERDRTPRPKKGRGKPDLVPGGRDFEVNQPDPEHMAAALEKWAAEWACPYVVVDSHPGGGRATLGAMNAASVVVTSVVLATAELDGLEGMVEEAAGESRALLVDLVFDALDQAPQAVAHRMFVTGAAAPPARQPTPISYLVVC